MDSNRLHRFSKVLDTNFGNVHLSTRVLPKCPQIDMTNGEALNITVPTTAFKPQKLLSLPNVDETLGLYSVHSRKGQVRKKVKNQDNNKKELSNTSLGIFFPDYSVTRHQQH